MENYIWLIPFLPFLAFVVTLFLGKWWIKASSHWLPILALVGSFALSIAGLVAVRGAEEPLRLELWRWMAVGSFRVPVVLQLDQLSAVMCLVVTGVGLLIFIYSAGYMHGDPGYHRFFAYMSVFAFSMLALVLAGNYLLLYFGWEAVGLCSYALIGYFYERTSAAAAAKKAFIVNRVGDFGFGLGVMLMFVTFGTLDYAGVLEQAAAGATSKSTLLGIALLLFMGAMGKSAQFPLHVWLPDAMEGPTPVSAFIHAATMVTAGVYMVARSAAIFAQVPEALIVVGAIGTFTAIFAAVIGICQKDIKRVLAYSTVSQLGYMFMALGVGAWAVAIFHLVTHAFFKALLFLGAGSVIHALGGEQDMDRMGGLARRIPVTYLTLTAGALALSGIFPFAGFWSKDDILGSAWREGQYVFWVVGLIAAFITAFYTFRLIFLTFFGRSRVDETRQEHVHESPLVMIVPLAVLAVASLLGGFIGLPGRLGLIQRFLEPVFAPANEILGIHEHSLGALDYGLMVLSLLVAMAGIVLAWLMYVRRTDLPVVVGRKLRPAYQVVYNKFYVDEFYAATVVRLAVDGSRWVWHNFDERVIDGAAHGLAWLWQHAGEGLRPLQTGRVQNYLLAMFIGLCAIAAVVVLL